MTIYNPDKLLDTQLKIDPKFLGNSKRNRRLFELTKEQGFMGNRRLRKSEINLGYQPWQIKEIVKCRKDPVYFVNNFCYIVNLDLGLIPFDTYDYQDDLIDLMHKNTRLIVKFPRQSGKTTTTAAYVVWEMIFKPYAAIAILANKEKTARGILAKVRLIYENLPTWIQQGVVEWSKSSVELENGARVEASATSSSAIRSMSISTLVLDECAFVEKGVWDEFFTSVYPTVSSSKFSKIFMISTPHGMNHFYKFWKEALKKLGGNSFAFYEIMWNQVPGRDEEWKKQTISEIGIDRWRQEFECEFLGSAGTLVSGAFMKIMSADTPLETRYDGKFRIYEYPKKDRMYVQFNDVGEGISADCSTSQIIDVTEMPWHQVATYQDNRVHLIEFPIVIKKIGDFYNHALTVVENNTIGEGVLNDLNYDHEYENIFYFGKHFGLKMTKKSKMIGCACLKLNIEDRNLEIVDEETMKELTTFIKKRINYEADKGYHDDLITPLVLFSYFMQNRFWVENWLDQDRHFNVNKVNNIEQDLLPIGFVSDGDETINMGDYTD